MRRLAAALALLMGVMAAPALSEATAYQAISCPRQGFVTACKAGLCWRWDDVNGLVIHTGQGSGAPCLMIRVTGSGGTDFSGYFDGILTPQIRYLLGDRLLAVSPLDTYALGDAALPGAMYAFLDEAGRRQALFRLFDTRWHIANFLNRVSNLSCTIFTLLGISLRVANRKGSRCTIFSYSLCFANLVALAVIKRKGKAFAIKPIAAFQILRYIDSYASRCSVGVCNRIAIVNWRGSQITLTVIGYCYSHRYATSRS